MSINVSHSNKKIKFERNAGRNVCLKEFSSFHTGGNAELFTMPGRMEDLVTTLKVAHVKHLPLTIIGGGTNVLISDQDIQGIVLCTKHLSRFSMRGNLFAARCGLSLDKAISISIEAGMQGLESLSGIPGTIGGAVRGNAGCEETQISDRLVYVDYFSLDGLMHRLPIEEIDFSYRHSIFMNMEQVVLFEAAFNMDNTGLSSEAKKIKEANKKKRRENGIPSLPSAGCIFKNPEGTTAGKLLDACGMKNKTYGGASFYAKHANIIVNNGKATSKDIFTLSTIGREAVAQKFNINLEYELSLIGNFDY